MWREITLNPEEKRVADLLVSGWQEGYRLTTVAQAMERLGMAKDDETRWRIGSYLEEKWRKRLGASNVFRMLGALRIWRWRWIPSLMKAPSLLADMKSWNRAVYILTEEEKLIGRYILQFKGRRGRLPTVGEIAEVVGLSEEEVISSLAMLDRIGFLMLEDNEGRLSYILASDCDRFTEGLGFSFHRVTLENGEKFNVP
jgi:hypothetical protein